MKTPEEIKEGLECCAEYGNCSAGCPYNPIKDCGHDLYSDALAYIQQLERERDAAVEELKKFNCASCIYEELQAEEEPCVRCSWNWGCKISEELRENHWQWRGAEVE